ncbi:hypothetical protein BDZ89DRAFT_394492 [Hymenopellis radicata]|nr:hypothetical protein BDZ89DRAFT_394492 [Hymenopellis radicata]
MTTFTNSIAIYLTDQLNEAMEQNCGDPWQGAPHTNIYTPGTTSGLWVGRMSIPVKPRLAEILSTPELNPAMSEMFLGMITAPMRIEELVSRCCVPVPPCTARSAPVIDTDSDEDEDMSDSTSLSPEESAELNQRLRSTFDDGMFNAFLPNGFLFRNRYTSTPPASRSRIPISGFQSHTVTPRRVCAKKKKPLGV